MSDAYLLSVGRGAALTLALFALADRDRYVIIQRHFHERTHDALPGDAEFVGNVAVAAIEDRGLKRLATHLAPIRRQLAA